MLVELPINVKVLIDKAKDEAESRHALQQLDQMFNEEVQEPVLPGTATSEQGPAAVAPSASLRVFGLYHTLPLPRRIANLLANVMNGDDILMGWE